jgi:hypothetical protein
VESRGQTYFGNFEHVKLSRNLAMLVVGMWTFIIQAAWESNPDCAGNDPVLLGHCKHVWESWEQVVYTMTALLPSADQIWGFRASVACLLVALHRGLPDSSWSGPCCS